MVDSHTWLAEAEYWHSFFDIGQLNIDIDNIEAFIIWHEVIEAWRTLVIIGFI